MQLLFCMIEIEMEAEVVEMTRVKEGMAEERAATTIWKKDDLLS